MAEDYQKMTVAELKELLKAADLPLSGKKADLIARLEEDDEHDDDIEEDIEEEDDDFDDYDDEEDWDDEEEYFHVAKQKPVLDEATQVALDARKAQKKVQPKFRRQEWFRYSRLKRTGWRKPKGYQCEIDRGKPAGVYGIGMGGWLFPKGPEQTADYQKASKNLFKPEEWNHFRVEAQGPRIRTYLNGKLIAEVEHKQSRKGRFGIQHHGKGGTVKFRNLRVRELK